MKTLTLALMTLIVLSSYFLSGCAQKSEMENKNINKGSLTRLITLSTRITKDGNKNESKQLLEELSKNYSKQYTCDIAPESTVFGDINDDGVDDVLFRYSVTDIETKNWPVCGWLIAFSNESNEYESYMFFDWISGHCSQRHFDLGFPVSINNGVITSSIDDYAEGDACCCPSIKRNLKFVFENEFQILSPMNIETKNN
jgi:hypothetical protein